MPLVGLQEMWKTISKYTKGSHQSY